MKIKVPAALQAMRWCWPALLNHTIVLSVHSATDNYNLTWVFLLNELAVLTGFRRFFAAVGSKKAVTSAGIAEW